MCVCVCGGGGKCGVAAVVGVWMHGVGEEGVCGGGGGKCGVAAVVGVWMGDGGYTIFSTITASSRSVPCMDGGSHIGGAVAPLIGRGATD